MGFPTIKPRRIYHRSWFSEALNIPGSIVAAGSSVVLAFKKIWYPSAEPAATSGDMWLAGLAVLGAVFAIAGAIVKVVNAKRKDDADDDADRMDGLKSACHIFHSLVRHLHNFSRHDYGRLRVTLHKVVPPKKKGEAPDEYEQLLDYIGDRKRSGQGRKFSTSSGITGVAIRENDVFAGSRNNVDHEAYIAEMVADWGFDEKGASGLSKDRNSWLAIPIEYGGEVTAVVYLDSTDKNCFKDDVLKRQIVNAARGLAVFINERYF